MVLANLIPFLNIVVAKVPRGTLAPGVMITMKKLALTLPFDREILTINSTPFQFYKTTKIDF